MSEYLVETRGLRKYFTVKSGLLHAVDGVDLQIRRGETFGVVGESGCGKSTLGRIILRLLEPTGGDVLYDGTSVMGKSKYEMRLFRKNMQMIFQDPFSSLNPRMSVQELIAEPILIHKMFHTSDKVYDEVARLMEVVGLAERLSGAYPHELDGGRRQRLGVARALALNPQFIVCDEPVSALDVSIQAQILNLLMDLQRDMKLTYIFITHDLSVVKHISNEIIVMYLGHCVERAPSQELFKNPLHPYTKALLSAIPVPKLAMRHKHIEVIKGEITSPINPKPGCRFAPRCPYANGECINNGDIPLIEACNGHFVSCVQQT